MGNMTEAMADDLVNDTVGDWSFVVLSSITELTMRRTILALALDEARPVNRRDWWMLRKFVIAFSYGVPTRKVFTCPFKSPEDPWDLDGNLLIKAVETMVIAISRALKEV